LLTAAGLLIFTGAVGKSAQFPLHVWLPDAMEGPTPVSALIHAATMVAAGVYLTVRLFPIFDPQAMDIIALVGGFTAFFAATIAITQNDIKRVLAYSTVSQLGYMIMALGVGSYMAAFFHLAAHAMFKAGLFLASGSVIHAMHHAYNKMGVRDMDPQDMRNMGGLKPKMPVTYWAFIIFTVAISGIPLTTGFLSKDAILAGTIVYYRDHQNILGYMLMFFGFGAAMITAFYMFRMIFLTFHGKPQQEGLISQIHESPSVMTLPLKVLAFLSLFFVFTIPRFNPFSDEGWFNEMVKMPEKAFAGMEGFPEHMVEALHQAHVPTIITSLTVALIGIILSVLFYYTRTISAERVAKAIKPLYFLSFRKYYIDEFYRYFVISPFLRLCHWIGILDLDKYDKYIVDGVAKGVERLSRFSGLEVDDKIIDGLLVNGVGRVSLSAGRQLRRIQTGKLQTYLAGAVVGVIVLIIIESILATF
jgi:NADH-quinone oxidoreductase subunit L